MKRILFTVVVLFFTTSLFAQRIQRSEDGLYGLAVTKSNGSVKWLANPKYSQIVNNQDGSFSVCDAKGKWGVITSAGKRVIDCQYSYKDQAHEAYLFYLDPSKKQFVSNRSDGAINQQNLDFTLTRDYTNYIKAYVEKEINAWQKKGEFEKSSDYQKRVTDATRKEKIAQLTKEVCDECLMKAKDKELRMRLGEYDADNETFLITTDIGVFVLPVSINKAPGFKSNWSNIISDNTYDIVNGKIILRSAKFYHNNKQVATYSDTNHALYALANVEYNFDPIEIPLQDQKYERQPQITQTTIQVGKSDVDVDIPVTKANKTNTFALVFANENYRDEVPVSYAVNDGRTVAQYFTKTLGIPSTNVHLVEDATKNDMVREIEWLRQIAKEYDGIDVLVYYAGHGCPDESNGSSYIIPIDGVSTSSRTLYSVNELYRELGEMSTNSLILFMDACFSGAKRGSGMLASARGIALKAKQEVPHNRMIVLSAAQGDETAWPYEEKKHGLFTYFMLKKLQESKGNITVGQLSEYVIKQVRQHSLVINSKRQTPSLSISPHFGDDWSEVKMR